MAASDNGRRYYEHPNHGPSRERLAVEVADLYMSTFHGLDPNSNYPNRQADPAAVGDGEYSFSNSSDVSSEFYRTKLREGFVDLRNSYHQKVSQKASLPNNYSYQLPVVATSQPAIMPYSRAPDLLNTRPLSLHAMKGHSLDSARHLDYNAESYQNSSESHLDFQPMVRSSSDLHLENSSSDPYLRRGYGSADMLEANQTDYTHMREGEFFAMLRNFRSDNVDQRVPAPPGVYTMLRGDASNGLNGQQVLPNSQYYPQKPAHPSHSHQGSFSSMTNQPLAGSPPNQSSDFGKRSPKSQKKSRPRSGDFSALLKKLRPAKGEGDTYRHSEGNDSQITEILSKLLPEERLRKKAFVHYDCQSIGLNFIDAAQRRQTTQQVNIKTGASAASHLDDNSEENPVYDVNSCPLVGQCSAFINEVGGELERNVSLCRITTKHRTPQYPGNESSRPLVHILKPPICNGLSILDGLPGADNRQSLVEKHRGMYVLEFKDRGCMYYRQYFRHSDHQNYFGIDENLGPVAISIRREKINPAARLVDPEYRFMTSSEPKPEQTPAYQYRVIVRTAELNVLRGVILEEALPSSNKSQNSSRGLPAKDIIDYVAPEIQLSCLKQAINDEKTRDLLLALDEQGKTESYKVGIMYCRAGQSTEEEMYNNQYSSPAFVQFLDLIGKKVQLKGYEGYKGGLDNKTDTTGTHSYYATCQAYEVMFHVSTLLPFESNRQQLLRKRHIGNDIVTVVFQEPGSLPFNVKSVRSQFQHVFIIVRVHDPNTDHTCYSVAVTRVKDVPAFGPPITQAKYPHGRDFSDFLIAKIINAENASHRSEKFQAMAVRTRGEYMKELANNNVTNTSLENSSKLGKFSLNVGGSKKKEKRGGKLTPDMLCRGGVCWPTKLEDFGSSQTIDVYLVISADVLAVIDIDSLEVLFTCWCSCIIGWTNCQPCEQNQDPGLRIYFNQGDTIAIKPIDQDDCAEIMERLRIVSPGCETVEMLLRRNEHGQLGFNVHTEGLISDVEQSGFAWDSGLRTGSRLVEICKVATCTLSYEQMIDLLRTTALVRVVVIPPHLDGKPRRGVEDRSADYQMVYPTEEIRPRTIQHNFDGEDNSAYYSEEEHSMHNTANIAKKVHTVTLRSNSSGGSSASPGSTLSGKNAHSNADRRLPADVEPSHARVRSYENNYSDTESVSKRPPPGPVYTPTQATNHYAPGNFSGQTGSNQPAPSEPSYAPRRITRHQTWNAKDWIHAPVPYSKPANQNSGHYERARSEYIHLSGSQELLANKTPNAKPVPNNHTPNHYIGNEGAVLTRTFSDESLHSSNKRVTPRTVPPPLPNKNRPDYVLKDPSYQTVAKRTEEDMEWNRLVSTASKAIEDAPIKSFSPESGSQNSNRSMLVGLSDKPQEGDSRLSRLEEDLIAERRRVRELEQKLQMEKTRNDDLMNQMRRVNLNPKSRPQ